MDITIGSFLIKTFPNFGWDFAIYGNTFLDFGEALVAFLFFLIIFKIFQLLLLGLFKSIEKRRESVGGAFISVLKKIRPPFYFFLSIYFSLQYLTFNPFAKKVIDAILLIWISYEIIKAIHIFLDFLIRGKFVKDAKDEGRHTAEVLSLLAKFVLWILGFLFVLSNMGVEITSLLAGLGIGGIAVAFAMQNILADIFSSFAIYLDKPFKVGDYIVVGTDEGTVKKIGIKTTRIDSVNGEELVISNNELTSVRVQNMQNIKQRRVKVNIGVSYATKRETLKKLPEILKEVVESVPGIEFGRAFFKSFDDSSLSFELIYFIDKYKDYTDYAQKQHLINCAIMDRFHKEKVEIPFPIRTVHLSK